MTGVQTCALPISRRARQNPDAWPRVSTSIQKGILIGIKKGPLFAIIKKRAQKGAPSTLRTRSDLQKVSLRNTVQARTKSILRHGWTPAGPRPSNTEFYSRMEMGSVHGSLTRLRGRALGAWIIWLMPCNSLQSGCELPGTTKVARFVRARFMD